MSGKPVPTAIDISLPFLDPLAAGPFAQAGVGADGCYDTCTVPLSIHIIADDNGENACATAEQVQNDVATANGIWEPCCIRFVLTNTDVIRSTSDQTVDWPGNMTTLCNEYSTYGNVVQVFYACNVRVNNVIVWGAAPGCCAFIGGEIHPARCGDSGETLAHELGHILVGAEESSIYCNLMLTPTILGCQNLTAEQCTDAMATCNAGGCWS